jgi:acetyl/propionyl-CoA carboxylase alpha subunit
MKRFVNGVESELAESSVEVVAGADRLFVRTPSGTRTAVAVRSGDAVLVSYGGRQYRVERRQGKARGGGAEGSGEIHAPMPGLIIDVMVAVGQVVRKGERLVVLEAMKTQQPFAAPFDGVVTAVGVKKGDQVLDGAMLVQVKPASS